MKTSVFTQPCSRTAFAQVRSARLPFPRGLDGQVAADRVEVAMSR